MPAGFKGFQKGRPKTGGREKDSIVRQRRSTKFVDRLRGYGFNYDHELAKILKDIRDTALSSDPDKPVDVRRIAELKFYYAELKSLLPFMTPKLREKQVEVVDAPSDDDQPTATRISDEDLLKAMNATQSEEATNNSGAMAPRPVKLPVPPSPEEDLPNVAGVEVQDS